MTPQQWDTIKFFDPNIDDFGAPEKMNYELILTVDAFRKYVDKPIIIHCGFEDRKTGMHPSGRAVDLHVQGLSLFDQFLAAQRFIGFTGIGIYTWWHSRGLHLDNRPLGLNEPRALWGSVSAGNSGYVKLTKNFLFGTM